LCTSHRVLRAQTFDKPGAFPHFQLLSLCTAGQDEGSCTFESEVLREQVDYYVDLLTTSLASGLQLHSIHITFIVIDEEGERILQSPLLIDLEIKYKNVEFQRDYQKNENWDYYRKLRFQISARASSGQNFLLIDGGFTDWTSKLLSNKKERLLISGLGSERLLHCFQ